MGLSCLEGELAAVAQPELQGRSVVVEVEVEAGRQQAPGEMVQLHRHRLNGSIQPQAT